MSDEGKDYVLYHHPLSICSIMVRYCYALRGTPKDPQSGIRMQEESVDILHGEQITEHYLCDINSLGEVPVLAHLPLEPGNTIPDSLKITLHMSESYPEMIPASHYDYIVARLTELHAINYFSLTFSGKPQTMLATQQALRKRQNEPISSRYRAAIEYKLAHMAKAKVQAVEPQDVEKNCQRTTALLQKLEPHLSESQTGWLFGFESPSALDAHLVVFLARLRDLQRHDLIPQAFEQYALKAMEGSAWNKTHQGPTIPPGA